MRSRHYYTAETISAKALIQRSFLLILIALSLFLIYAERKQNGITESVRLVLLDMTLPVIDLLSSPIAGAKALYAGAQDVLSTYEENKRLKLDNAALMEWKAAALKLESENRALRELMAYQPPTAKHFITARVIGSAAGGLSHRVHINAGSDRQIEANQAVMTADGLIGRVIHVAGGHSEILLLSDTSSRIPVQLQPSGLKGILIGDHHRLPYLKLQNPKSVPLLGETVMTSADGNILPDGLPIGKLFAENGGRWQVRPAYQDKTLDFVKIIQPRTPSAAATAADAPAP